MIDEEKIVADLLTKGFGVMTENAQLATLFSEAVEAAAKFFAFPNEVKEAYSTPSILEGYRSLGVEYSAFPERPDLTESFSLWPRNCGRKSVLTWASSLELYAKLNSLVEPLSEKTYAVLESIRVAFNRQAAAVEFKDMSYLQINYYEPQRHSRDYLQDSHEDGHLLTLVRATEEGLEIKIDGQFQPAPLASDQFLVMPGSLLTIMTGGRIQPIYHRVRTHYEIPSRLSLMFFVNPALDVEITPWVSNDFNRGIDVRNVAINNSALFGLSSLAEIQTRSGDPELNSLP